MVGACAPAGVNMAKDDVTKANSRMIVIAEFFAFLFLKRIFLTMFIGQAGRTFSYN